PPRWCCMESDEAPWFPLVDPVPDVLRLEGPGRCRCGAVPADTVPKRLLPCVIYGSQRVYHRQVEVRPCFACSDGRKFAGPDLGELGIFNFNNRSMYTHELLNAFTSGMTAHELPFHAFVTTVDRSYLEHGPANPQPSDDFVSDETFRRVWYSWRRLQLLGDTFSCDDCGPSPPTVIFDGLTAGFPGKYVTPTLTPPTTVLPGAPVRDSVR
ncbi:hypothetical protein AURDEDRAFT_21844, partial [Auricularia subglabra TFB-10046 SS5]